MSFWSVARRPRWIGALILALAVAAGFAALGQWQLERSVDAAPPPFDTEAVVPLTSVAKPQEPMFDEGYRLVVAQGEFVPGDFMVLSDRLDVDARGYWVIGHAVLTDGASLAVALGWTESEDAAASAISQLRSTAPTELSGRYLPSEAPTEQDFQAGTHSALAVAELINLWEREPDGVYAGYLILADAPAGLEAIDAPPPSGEISLNLLNVFYAIEWVVFAGFAVFLWYRLVRDVVEAEAHAGADGDGHL